MFKVLFLTQLLILSLVTSAEAQSRDENRGAPDSIFSPAQDFGQSDRNLLAQLGLGLGDAAGIVFLNKFVVYHGRNKRLEWLEKQYIKSGRDEGPMIEAVPVSKAYKIIGRAGELLFLADILGRIYVWKQLDADPGASPLVTYSKGVLYRLKTSLSGWYDKTSAKPESTSN